MQARTHTIPNTPLKFLIEVSKPHAVWAVTSLTVVVFAQSCYKFLSYVFQQVVDQATAYGAGTVPLEAVGFWVALYPITILVAELLYRTSGFLGFRWSTGTRVTSHVTLFDYLSRHSAMYFANRFAGALTSSITNVVNGVANMVELFLWQYLSTIINILLSVVLVWTASPMITFVFLGWLAIILPTNIFFMRKVGTYSKEAADSQSKLRGLTVDVLTNILAVGQFARRGGEVGRVSDSATAYRKLAMKERTTSETGLLINSLLMSGFIISMTAASYYYWTAGEISLGQFILIFTLTWDLIGAFVYLGPSLNHTAELYGESKEGLDEILQPYEITDYPKAKPLALTKGTISFDDVGFAYGTRSVFKNFSVTLRGGERVGIVGPSGSGKTTFVSLLLRQQDVHEGEILIDGQNVRKVTLESLRQNIAVVPQEPLLFHRTIKENIAYGKPDATLEEIQEAARRAEAHEFIMALPDQYETMVGERGVKLSGGQRQRIAIARAILKAAPILVLDEATSSLDSESESSIQKALVELMRGKTVIAIAHRLSTIRAMDRILVIDQGTITEDGTHEELVEKEGGTYARLWNHQAGGFLTDEEVEDEKVGE